MLSHEIRSQHASNVEERELELFPAASPATNVPELIHRFAVMAEPSCSSVGTQSVSVSSSDLSAESVADADEAISNEYAGDMSELQCPLVDDEQDVRRCGSEGSMITTEPSLKLGFDDSVNRTRWNEQDRSTNTLVASSASSWTDDKHSSYLNSIEATFVKNMYGREYCAPDLCGHAPQQADSSEQDCCESRPLSATTSVTESETWQLGGWRPAIFTRPFLSQISASAPPALLTSSWINHYRPAVDPKFHKKSISHPGRSFFRGDTFGLDNNLRHAHDQRSQEIVGEQDIHFLQDRLQRHLYTSTNSSLSSKKQTPQNIRTDSSCSSSGTLKHWISKQGLVRMGSQMNQNSIHHSCERLLQEHEEPRSQELCLNTDLQLCSTKWEAPEKLEQKIIKNMDSQMAEKSIYAEDTQQNFESSTQTHVQPASVDYASITEPHLSSRKRKVHGGLLERIARPSKEYSCSAESYDQVQRFFW